MIAVKKRADNENDVEKNHKQDNFIDRFLLQDECRNTMSAVPKVISDEFTSKAPSVKRPEPIDEEIVLDPKKYILSKTDTKGIIEYGNEYFVQIAGYKEEELVGQPHNIIRHPDMPKVAFKLLWKRIKNRENIVALVKNLAKDGRYYWVVTDFEIKVDEITNEITGYFAYRRAAPRDAIKKIEPLYKKLVEIEKASGMDGSQKYLIALLESQNKTYDEFIDEITGRNSGMMKIWFNAMKKFFSH